MSYLSRRDVLRSTGAVALGVAAGPALGLTSAHAALPSDATKFNLAASNKELLREIPLKHPTVMQSFTYDPVTNDLYTVQVRSGEGHLGNLVVTKNPRVGKDQEDSYMVLYGFGHGATLGLHREGSQVYLWSEYASGSVSSGSDAFGKRIAMVKWKHDGRTNENPELVTDRTPAHVVGKSPRPVVDAKHGLLVIRYTKSETTYGLVAYPIAEARNGNFSNPVYSTDVPRPPGTSQGTAVHGQFVYLLNGNGYSSSNPYPGNTTLYRYKMVDGGTSTQEDSFVSTYLGKTLTTLREPEGLAIWAPLSSTPHLAYGLADGPSGARNATIAGKPAA